MTYNCVSIYFYIERNINQELRVLLVMAVLFVFCEFFPIVGDFYELICTLKGYSADGACPYNVYIENCIHFGHFMLVVNSSVNFIFYMMNIVKFRQGFVKVNLWEVNVECVYYSKGTLITLTLYIIYLPSSFRHFVAAFNLVTVLKLIRKAKGKRYKWNK